MSVTQIQHRVTGPTAGRQTDNPHSPVDPLLQTKPVLTNFLQNTLELRTHSGNEEEARERFKYSPAGRLEVHNKDELDKIQQDLEIS